MFKHYYTYCTLWHVYVVYFRYRGPRFVQMTKTTQNVSKIIIKMTRLCDAKGFQNSDGSKKNKFYIKQDMMKTSDDKGARI